MGEINIAVLFPQKIKLQGRMSVFGGTSKATIECSSCHNPIQYAKMIAYGTHADLMNHQEIRTGPVSHPVPTLLQTKHEHCVAVLPVPVSLMKNKFIYFFTVQ